MNNSDSYCCIFAKGRHFALPAKVLISLYLLQTTHFKVGEFVTNSIATVVSVVSFKCGQPYLHVYLSQTTHFEVR